MTTLHRLWHEDDGVLSFEWTLLLTLLTLGIVAGLAAARDAIIDEFGDVAQAMLALDHSMTIDFPLQVHRPRRQRSFVGQRQLVHRRADLFRLRAGRHPARPGPAVRRGRRFVVRDEW